jgi:long-chain-fatty-acid--[acyl-carrier-protein] ligase
MAASLVVERSAKLRALRFLLWLFARSMLALRYRIHVHGLDKIRKLDGPILVLPNHPAYIDPLIVLNALFSALHPRPLLFEGNFRTPLLRFVMRVLDALRVPDLEQASEKSRRRANQAIEDIKQALRNRQNIILWPAGRVERTGVEHLGAARTLSEVLRDVPEAKMVLVRTRGLWGSRFSWGWSGEQPPFFKRVLQGAGYILANLIFFAPRRKVDITLEYVERSRLPGIEREVLNPWLEKWYNVDAPEKPTFVPAHFLFGPRTRDYPEMAEEEELDPGKLPAQTRQAVDEMLAEKLHRSFAPGELKPETLLEQLGMDSLDRMELSLGVERRFGFTGDVVPASMGQLYALAAGLLPRKPPKPPPETWFPSRRDDRPLTIEGDTIAAALVHRALAQRRDVITADDRSGALTYERLLVGALNMARHFRELPGDNAGLLLPSSVGCDVALLGLYLAGKLPVVLNWTTGPANLAHAARIMNLRHVITSKAFVDRVGVKVGDTSWVFLEDLGKKIGKLRLLLTLLNVRFLPGMIRSAVPRPSPDSPAVVLFTSGSEKAPKAVPLTHRNLLSNQRQGMGVLGVKSNDSVLGFLPAFHSFGISITGLFPLLTGMRVIRHPDPTDAAALARKIGMYKPTLLVGTPTFVGYILDRAEPGELTSLRLVVVGAEKCPQSIFDRFAQAAPQAKVLEGYGITECSPVVSVNPPDDPRPGTVGKPLPGVEVCVIDLESEQTLPAGKMGMLLVSGPTIFPGYIAYEGDSPFRERDGKRWYVTGDLVEIDTDGYIHFSGRLKRFLKAGGEMISLPALEEPFVRLYPPTKDGPRVAVEGVEADGGRRIVLFTTEQITLREANDVLLREGFHGVLRLDEVRRVDKLPVLGTGKTDYKVLRAQILAKEEAREGAVR